MAEKAEKTYWNGEPATCRRVLVRVAEGTEQTPPLAWWRGLEGTVRRAVEVRYFEGSPFYLDDDDVPTEVHAQNQALREADPVMSKLGGRERLHAPLSAGPARAGSQLTRLAIYAMIATLVT